MSVNCIVTLSFAYAFMFKTNTLHLSCPHLDLHRHTFMTIRYKTAADIYVYRFYRFQDMEMVTISCVPRNKYIFREKINCTFIKRQMRGYVFIFIREKEEQKHKQFHCCCCIKSTKEFFELKRRRKGIYWRNCFPVLLHIEYSLWRSSNLT